ncbi:hypothetical protein AB406_1715 [Riemerella anatipestifer]|uniref:Uncharacterized protein n=1 Tax=Riemerella anatipestifer TaxID=34085 RepID=A0A1S7DUC3_RIEAN|nr:hypothetical protein AB406_1715 [Riemerella anatipestifer]
MIKNKLYVVLFSGGRTSAFLSKYIKEKVQDILTLKTEENVL